MSNKKHRALILACFAQSRYLKLMKSNTRYDRTLDNPSADLRKDMINSYGSRTTSSFIMQMLLGTNNTGAEHKYSKHFMVIFKFTSYFIAKKG